MKSIAKALAGVGTAAFVAGLLVMTVPTPAQDQAPAQDPSSETGGVPETETSRPSPEIMALIEGLEAETSQALWCAGAFSLLGAVSQSEEESAALTQLAQGLVVVARSQIADENVDGADFIALVAGFNALVLEEFETQADTPMRYTPDECFEATDLPAPTEGDDTPEPEVPASESETAAPEGDEGAAPN